MFDKNIMIVVAHPDDEVLGMGGTIAKLHNQNNHITLLIVTDGSTSQYSNEQNIEQILKDKMKETQKSAELLGINKIIYGDLPDMKLDCVEHILINQTIEKAIEEVNPDIIFTHFYGDVNVDHQMVYKSTLVAARPLPSRKLKELYCFDVPSSTEWSPQLPDNVFMPNYFVDIEDFAPIKYRAMNEYKTELREYPHPRSVEYLEQIDIVTGLKVGIKKAESFMLLRRID